MMNGWVVRMDELMKGKKMLEGGWWMDGGGLGAKES